MSDKKKEHPSQKTRLHTRNKHRERYDFKLLIKCCPELAEFVTENIYGDETIDFFNADAVRMLNRALLMHYYGLSYWEIPANYLCPPIPGRADYIHHIADVLSSSNYGKIPTGDQIKCFDIGVGANCVYPIIGNSEYGWSFIGSEIDPVALDSANKIIESNPNLVGKIECRLQPKASETFFGVIQKDERIDLSICNPPFHASLEESQAGTLRKLSNLKKKKITKPEQNFGGQGGELWTEGGEREFILRMIKQSTQFAKSCCWFSTLVSKQSNLKHIYDLLDKIEAKEYKTIPMGQGNKTSRIVAWTFLSVEEEKDWVKERWNEE
jgi:23S rRNA (adenine1618-N6)-methyltransferase